MKEYKIGNKGTCIIRSSTSGNIGQIEMEYGNQPYTILKNVDATVSFADVDGRAKAVQQELFYNTANLNSIKISNVNLTDKILNLIYSKKEEVFIHYVEKSYSDENNKVFLPSSDPKYQVFVYNEDEQLERAFGVVEDNYIEVEKANSPYLVVYSCLAEKGFALNKSHYMYLTLDYQVDGNDESNQKRTYCFHFHKCALKADQNLYFNNGINTVDLEFKIIRSNEDYVTIK